MRPDSTIANAVCVGCIRVITIIYYLSDWMAIWVTFTHTRQEKKYSWINRKKAATATNIPISVVVASCLLSSACAHVLVRFETVTKLSHSIKSFCLSSNLLFSLFHAHARMALHCKRHMKRGKNMNYEMKNCTTEKSFSIEPFRALETY